MKELGKLPEPSVEPWTPRKDCRQADILNSRTNWARNANRTKSRFDHTPAPMWRGTATVSCYRRSNEGVRVGQRFDGLLATHRNAAYTMTCPSIGKSKVNGESKQYPDMVSSGPDLASAVGLSEHGLMTIWSSTIG